MRRLKKIPVNFENEKRQFHFHFECDIFCKLASNVIASTFVFLLHFSLCFIFRSPLSARLPHLWTASECETRRAKNKANTDFLLYFPNQNEDFKQPELKGNAWFICRAYCFSIPVFCLNRGSLAIPVSPANYAARQISFFWDATFLVYNSMAQIMNLWSELS